MTEKPDWFKISEADQKPSELAPRPKNHLFRIAAVAVPLALVGAIAVGANEDFEDHEHTPAIDTTLSTSTNSTGAVFSETNSKTSNNAVVASVNSNNPTSVVLNNPVATNSSESSVGEINPIATNSNVSSPGKVGVGVPMPKGNGDDEGREKHHEREGQKKSEHHESGENSFEDDD